MLYVRANAKEKRKEEPTKNERGICEFILFFRSFRSTLWRHTKSIDQKSFMLLSSTSLLHPAGLAIIERIFGLDILFSADNCGLFFSLQTQDLISIHSVKELMNEKIFFFKFSTQRFK